MSHHDTLGIPRDSSKKEIRAAYLRLAKLYHPDSTTGNNKIFLKVQHAYEVLHNPKLEYWEDDAINEHYSKQRAWEAKMNSMENEMKMDKCYYNFEEWERGHGLGKYANLPPKPSSPTNAFGQTVETMTKEQAYFFRRTQTRKMHTAVMRLVRFL